MMSLMIVTSSVVGVVQGEWKGTTWRSRTQMVLGLCFLVVAVVIIGLGPAL